ncbi:MAG: hypothetical protein NC102_05430 [Clostridium sp.]|nr:hypothetical protein [Clostridium sp.]
MPLYTNLSVAAIPLDIASVNKEENLLQASKSIARIPAGADLVVFPELFTTAFIPDRQLCLSLAEENDGPTMSWAKRTAHVTGAAIAGSFLAKEGGRLFNRAFFVEPTGDAVFYDKRHTFSIGRESDVLSKGEAVPPVVRFRGWNIAICVCYDLRFPAWMRNVDYKYDLMLIPANWPEARSYAWEHLLIARAIENQSYVIGANRSGSDSFGDYGRTSRIIDFRGMSVGEENDSCLHARLSKNSLQKFRETMPVSRDADDFILKIR